MKTFPPYDPLKEQAMRYVAQKAQCEMITALREKAKIERFDEAAKPTRRRRPRGARRRRRACDPAAPKAP